jgi:hypothetical protein
MRRSAAFLVALGMFLGSQMAFAQDEEARSRFYDFDNMLIDGQFQTPDLLRYQARERAQFQRLLDLKKSFLPKIQETTEEAALQ